jgi:hypothetical protein
VWLSDFLNNQRFRFLTKFRIKEPLFPVFGGKKVPGIRGPPVPVISKKHQRTDGFLRKEPEKNRRLERQCFTTFSKKKKRPTGLYQISDRFFIKKNSPATGKWVYMQCTQVVG